MKKFLVISALLVNVSAYGMLAPFNGAFRQLLPAVMCLNSNHQTSIFGKEYKKNDTFVDTLHTDQTTLAVLQEMDTEDKKNSPGNLPAIAVYVWSVNIPLGMSGMSFSEFLPTLFGSCLAGMGIGVLANCLPILIQERREKGERSQKIRFLGAKSELDLEHLKQLSAQAKLSQQEIAKVRDTIDVLLDISSEQQIDFRVSLRHSFRTLSEHYPDEARDYEHKKQPEAAPSAEGSEEPFFPAG